MLGPRDIVFVQDKRGKKYVFTGCRCGCAQHSQDS